MLELSIHSLNPGTKWPEGLQSHPTAQEHHNNLHAQRSKDKLYKLNYLNMSSRSIGKLANHQNICSSMIYKLNHLNIGGRQIHPLEGSIHPHMGCKQIHPLKGSIHPLKGSIHLKMGSRLIHP